jgi:hypothetical protein
VITFCLLVELGWTPGAGASSTAASEELDVDETLLGQPVQVISRGLTRNPERVGRLVSPDGLARPRDEDVEAATGRVAQRSDGVEIGTEIVHPATLKRGLVGTRFLRM